MKVLDSLVQRGIAHHLAKLQCGLEKESLRVDPNGVLSQSPHPHALGSALTHPSITTDYSESLLEFVTGVHSSTDSLLKELYDIHHFTYQYIGDQKLWVSSMPCIVESEEKIPIARYGSSNIAKMKEAYRRGLSHRYGSLMQTIAGIHFNFSMPEAFWNDYYDIKDGTEIKKYRSASYFNLIRNFHRNSWLGAYLFGASPAVCRSFLRGREHMLENFDAHSFYAPNATSLRLSGLGYSNEAQSNIEICYNGVDPFVQSLRKAIQTSHPAYTKLGVKVDGEYQQLNPNLLQIENEFYSSIRPKRISDSGESPSRALGDQGVQYIEVRSIDLNPFEPIGIHADCARFFEIFLLYCMFEDSPDMTQEEFMITKQNQKTMVMNGRDKSAEIITPGGLVNSRTQMKKLLESMRPVAELIDQTTGTGNYVSTLEKQMNKVSDSDLTPSARIINQMLKEDLSFYEFSMRASEISEQKFKKETIATATQTKYENLARKSHLKQAEIEKSDSISFDKFLEDYFKKQNAP
jgi:glutamate--cysteine ligase